MYICKYFFNLVQIIIRHMTGSKENSTFCFLETFNVPQGEAEGNTEGQGETKLTVFL